MDTSTSSMCLNSIRHSLLYLFILISILFYFTALNWNRSGTKVLAKDSNMKLAVGYIIAVFSSMCFRTCDGNQLNTNWAQKLIEVTEVRDSFVGKLDDLAKLSTLENKETVIEEFINLLEDVPSQLNGLNNLDIEKVDNDRTTLQQLFNQPQEPLVERFFRSKNLAAHYKERSLGFIIKTIKAYYDYECVRILMSPLQSKQVKPSIPVQAICSRVNEDLGKSDRYTFSADKICKNIKRCSGITNQRPYGDKEGTNVKEACKSEEDPKCDVSKALPMIGALLWYKISDFIAQSYCSNALRQPTKDALGTELTGISTMANLMMAYSSTFYWTEFFREAVEKRAYSNLPNAMSLVAKREKSLGFVSLACSELKADDACAIERIHAFYQSLKKLKQDRSTTRTTKNLRMYPRMDHKELIKLNKSALDHIELLGDISSLNRNLQTAVTGISKYFHGLATYDQGIAEADVTYLTDKLNDYSTRMDTLSKKLQKDMRAAMAALKTAQVLQAIEEVVLLKLKIAENLNPLKALFGGVSAGDIYEQSVEVARAFQELTRSIALLANLESAYTDTMNLAKAFTDNTGQIASLNVLVEAIKKNKINDVGIDADKFIGDYGGYTPKVDRSKLAKNDALWGAFKESTCDLLYGAQGIGAAAVQTVTGGMLLCENLEGTLAEFTTLREDIFDFQFDLVDALARVVRGNVAKKLAKSISVSNDLLSASQLLLGFFMTQYRLQSHVLLYCDKLEYLNEGKAITPCKQPTGFYTKDDLVGIIGYDADRATKSEVERFVYIPTRPEFKGDKGFINLPSLAKGNSVIFKIPDKKSWLKKYNWLVEGEEDIPYVLSFKLYLPQKMYKKGNARSFSSTKIDLVSVAVSSFGGDSGVVYNLPLEHSIYSTIYSEGYTRCPRGKQIKNPYKLCKKVYVPKICDTSTRIPPAKEAVMPTILSTWKLSYTKGVANNKLKWDAPQPATNLLLIGKVKLQFIHSGASKAKAGKRSTSRRRREVSHCCSGNQYRKEWWTKACVPCPTKPPTDSVSNLGGYYCEKGIEPVASKLCATSCQG